MTFNSSKSFTLVEMLIVFVVLGVLFSALIPRILVTQMKARNTSRVTALSQIHMGLRLHYLDNFFFPAELGLLVGSYLTSIPVDPSVKTISPCRAPYTDRTAFYNPAGFYYAASGYIGYNGFLYSFSNSNKRAFIGARMEDDGTINSYGAAANLCTLASQNSWEGLSMVMWNSLQSVVQGGLTSKGNINMIILQD